MIANFVLMGELYQHNPFDTEAAPWNTYPWHIGADNGLEFQTSLQQFAMTKTIWRIEEDPAAQGLEITGATLGDFSMFATLIVMDQWGNLGSDVGQDPDPIPSEDLPPTVIGGGVIEVSSTYDNPYVDVDSAAESPPNFSPTVLSASAAYIGSEIQLIVADSNSETDASGCISVVGGGVTAATSTYTN